jgi:hypothetical protein
MKPVPLSTPARRLAGFALLAASVGFTGLLTFVQAVAGLFR